MARAKAPKALSGAALALYNRMRTAAVTMDVSLTPLVPGASVEDTRRALAALRADPGLGGDSTRGAALRNLVGALDRALDNPAALVAVGDYLRREFGC